MGGIPIKVCKSPVTAPARIPAINAASIASHKLHPFRISITATAPPVANEPSTVRSAISRMRYVI